MCYQLSYEGRFTETIITFKLAGNLANAG